MADSLRVTRQRAASDGGGAIERFFTSVPDGSGIEIYVDGVLTATHNGDIEVRYDLAGTGGALTQAAVGAADEKSRYSQHIPVTERTGGLSGT